MTQPTVIFFGPDTPRSKTDGSLPKVSLRALLFDAAKRGRIVESLHVALSRNETHKNCNIWTYGNEKLVRGSGLFGGKRALKQIITSSPRDTQARFSLQRESIGSRCLLVY